MKTFFARTMAVLVAIGLMVPFAAEAYQQMYVFGYSLSDGGNAYKIIGDAYPGTEFPLPRIISATATAWSRSNISPRISCSHCSR